MSPVLHSFFTKAYTVVIGRRDNNKKKVRKERSLGFTSLFLSVSQLLLPIYLFPRALSQLLKVRLKKVAKNWRDLKGQRGYIAFRRYLAWF